MSEGDEGRRIPGGTNLGREILRALRTRRDVSGWTRLEVRDYAVVGGTMVASKMEVGICDAELEGLAEEIVALASGGSSGGSSGRPLYSRKFFDEETGGEVMTQRELEKILAVAEEVIAGLPGTSRGVACLVAREIGERLVEINIREALGNGSKDPATPGKSPRGGGSGREGETTPAGGGPGEDHRSGGSGCPEDNR